MSIANPPRFSKGFSLVEITVVLVVIGLLFLMITQNRGAVSSAQTKELIATIHQLKEVTSSFRERYKGLPGDIANGSQLISSLTAADNGDGDGLISIAESAFVGKHLSASGVMPSANTLFGAAGSPGVYNRISLVSYAIAASVTSPCSTGIAIDNTAPTPAVANVILIERVPAEVAIAIDREFDDGIFNSGKVRASATYTGGTTVACVAVPLT